MAAPHLAGTLQGSNDNRAAFWGGGALDYRILPIAWSKTAITLPICWKELAEAGATAREPSNPMRSYQSPPRGVRNGPPAARLRQPRCPTRGRRPGRRQGPRPKGGPSGTPAALGRQTPNTQPALQRGRQLGLRRSVTTPLTGSTKRSSARATISSARPARCQSPPTSNPGQTGIQKNAGVTCAPLGAQQRRRGFGQPAHEPCMPLARAQSRWRTHHAPQGQTDPVAPLPMLGSRILRRAVLGGTGHKGRRPM